MKASLDHIIEYYDVVTADKDDAALTREVVKYGRALRQEGAYKHKDTNMYSMGINEREIVTNHALYPNLFGYEFDTDAAGSAVASTIQALIGNSGVGSTHCEKDYDGQGRVACATKVNSPTGVITVIAGLHHEQGDSAFVLPDCTGFTLATNAKEVFDNPSDANLEAYVQGVIVASQEFVAKVTADEFEESLEEEIKQYHNDEIELPDLYNEVLAKQDELGEGLIARLYDKAACFGSEDFKHENIYAFIMGAGGDHIGGYRVLFNGNNFDLNGTNLILNDNQLSGEKNIAELFNDKLGGEVAVGNSAYVNYHWDDPTDPNNDVPDFFENNVVPEDSCKRSYIEVANLNAKTEAVVLDRTGVPFFSLPVLNIFGSGTYLGDEVCDSGDGGCAIAGAMGHASQSTLLNLFLIASLLLSVVFLRKRA